MERDIFERIDNFMESVEELVSMLFWFLVVAGLFGFMMVAMFRGIS